MNFIDIFNKIHTDCTAVLDNSYKCRRGVEERNGVVADVFNLVMLLWTSVSYWIGHKFFLDFKKKLRASNSTTN